MKKKGKDLKTGDVILKPWYELVVEIDTTNTSPFWKGPHIMFFDLNDASNGQCGRQLPLDDEFEIATERKDFIEAFRIVQCDLANSLASTLEQIQEVKKLHDEVFLELNKKGRTK